MSALRPFLRLFVFHPWRLALGIVLAIVTLLASIALLTLSGWFLAASSLAGIAGLYTFNYMLPAAGVRGAAIIRTTARYSERLISHDATFRVLQHLRIFTFSRLIALAPGQLGAFRQSDLLNRFVGDVDLLDHLYLRVIAPLLGALVVIVVVTTGIAMLNIPLGMVLGGIMLATLLLMPAIFYRAGTPAGRAIAQSRADWRAQLMRWLNGQAELTLYGLSARWRQQLDNTETQWQDAQRQQQRLQALAQSLPIALGGVTVTLLFWLSAGLWLHTSSSALIALVVFCALAAFESLGPVASAFLPLAQVVVAARRVNAIVSQTPALHFPAHAAIADGSLSVCVKQIGFSYPTRQQPVLDRLSLRVEAGEHIALLGPTGCGKSTLLALLTRADEAKSGLITLQDLPLADWDEKALRQRISVVTQRVHLFNQSLQENLRIACPDASDKRLTAVLQQTGLLHLLESSDGLDLWLGEGGRPLSGGELRRLAIARAILHDGDLWLLDEPTEGLDATTEAQILALLQQVTAGKTLIMVTHRLSGLENMDRLCIMDDGNIVEQGSHRELLQRQGRYWQFCQRFAL